MADPTCGNTVPHDEHPTNAPTYRDTNGWCPGVAEPTCDPATYHAPTHVAPGTLADADRLEAALAQQVADQTQDDPAFAAAFARGDAEIKAGFGIPLAQQAQPSFQEQPAMSEKTKADLMWEAQRVFDDYEMELHELCEQHKIPYEDWTHDPYDGSLELYGFAPGYLLSKAQQVALWAFGFQQCWTHTAKREDPTDEEHHYSASKASQIEIQAAQPSTNAEIEAMAPEPGQPALTDEARPHNVRPWCFHRKAYCDRETPQTFAEWWNGPDGWASEPSDRADLDHEGVAQKAWDAAKGKR